MFSITFLWEAVIVSVVLYAFIKLIIALKIKVHINVKSGKNSVLYDLAHLKQGRSEGAGYDIRLVADNDQVVGKLAVKDEKCWLFTPKSSEAISSDKLKFAEIGYVDTDGYIFVARKGQTPERIGFLARPSAPTVPTLKGERSWRDLWLKSRLNVYFGDPDGNLPRISKDAIKNSNKEGVDQGSSSVSEIPSSDGQASSLSFAARPKEKANSNETIIITPDPELASEPEKEEEVLTEPAFQQEPESNPLSEPESIAEPEPLPEDPELSQAPEAEPDPIPEPEPELTSLIEPDPITESIPEAIADSHSAIVQDPGYVVDEKEQAYLESVIRNSSPIIEEILKNMVKVEGGDFMMGSSENADNEGPVHKVTLSSFCIGRFPVTQRIWNAVMGYNPSDQINDEYPVAPVNWNECMLFANRVSAITGLKFTLPTEAQWEFAARGGNSSHGYIFSGSNNKETVAWDNAYSPVGKKKANELGLYDMSGLVREWCLDWYVLRYSAENQFDPMGPPMPEDPEERKHVVRSPFGNDTVTSRKGELADNPKAFKSYGFRLVCEPDEKLGRREKPVLVGQSVKSGFFGGSPSICPIPDEAQGGIYALFYYRYAKNLYRQYLGESPYGWADTALVSSIIFSAIFLVLYFINTVVFQMPLLGKDLMAIPLMTVFFFILWAVIRAIKIESAENGKSFQPILDLLNKAVGHKKIDLIVIILAYLCAIWTFFFYDADFIPLILAIAIGFTVNKFIRKSADPWNVIDPLDPQKEDALIEIDIEDEPEEVILKAPEGSTKREYFWKLDSFDGKTVKANLVMMFDQKTISNQRLKNPFFLEKPDLKAEDYKNYIEKMREIVLSDDSFNYHSRYLIQEIQRIAIKNNLDEKDTLQFVLDFIQEPESLGYELDEKSRELAMPKEYIRFPDETLYDQQGDCDCKAFLAGVLYYLLGYDILLLISRQLGHAAVAIAVNDKTVASYFGEGDLDDYTIDINGHKYYYCETTTDGFRIGDLPQGGSTNSFETRIEWRHTSDEK